MAIYGDGKHNENMKFRYEEEQLKTIGISDRINLKQNKGDKMEIKTLDEAISLVAKYEHADYEDFKSEYGEQVVEAIENFLNSGNKEDLFPIVHKEVIGDACIPYFSDGIQLESGCNRYDIIEIMEDKESTKYYARDNDGRYKEIKEKFTGSRYIRSYGEKSHEVEFFDIGIHNINTKNERFKEFYASLKTSSL